MLMKSLGVCWLAMAMPRAAAPQTASDMQKILDRLDKLEDENHKLLEEIHDLRVELKAARSPDQPAAPSTEERLGVVESRTADLDQSKVAASQRFPVSLTGMLLFNAFENGRSSGGAEYPETASATPGAATDGASVRQTILGMKFNGPDLFAGGKASGSLYMDFFGGTSAPGNNLLRIRTATLDLSWKNTTFSVGQDKPIISPRDPSSFAPGRVSPLTGAGNLRSWNPQVRVEQRFSFGEESRAEGAGGVYETDRNIQRDIAGSLLRIARTSRPAYQGGLILPWQ